MIRVFLCLLLVFAASNATRYCIELHKAYGLIQEIALRNVDASRVPAKTELDGHITEVLSKEIVAHLSADHPTLEFAIRHSYEDCNVCDKGMCTLVACDALPVTRLYIRGTTNVIAPREFAREWTESEMRERWLHSLSDPNESWPFAPLDGDRPPRCE